MPTPHRDGHYRFQKGKKILAVVYENWSSNNAIQTAYYNFIREQGFIEEKDAPRKDKDARQKTSGLVDLGIIDDERRLTDAGRTLLAIAESGNFSKENVSKFGFMPKLIEKI